MSMLIVKVIDPDLGHVISHDDHLEQSHDQDLGQYSFKNTGPG